MSDEARIEAAAKAIIALDRDETKPLYTDNWGVAFARAALAAADAAGDTVTVSRDDLRAVLEAAEDLVMIVEVEWSGAGNTAQEAISRQYPSSGAAYERLRAIVEANT